MDKIYHSVRLIILNTKNELLLMFVDDPTTTTIEGIYRGPYWHLVGGQIEEGEDIQKAALRELFEETGLSCNEVELGPVVWNGNLELILSGKKTLMYQEFMVVRSKSDIVHLDNLTSYEKNVVKKLDWFPFNKIESSKDTIYPFSLKKHLPEILKGRLPERPITIDLN